jgi:hypothetical protein
VHITDRCILGSSQAYREGIVSVFLVIIFSSNNTRIYVRERSYRSGESRVGDGFVIGDRRRDGNEESRLTLLLQ